MTAWGKGLPAAPVATPKIWRSRLGWAALALVLLAVATMTIFGFLAYVGHDRPELFDTTVVAERTEAACARLEMELMSPAGPAPQQVQAGNRAIDALIRDVRALGDPALEDDLPAVDWLGDWASLRDAGADLVRRLATDPAAKIALPQTEDGFPVTKRMIYAAGPRCERAADLASQPPGP